VIEPESNESVQSLKAADAAREAVLAHSDELDATEAAVEVKGAARRVEDGNSSPRDDDSALVVAVLAVGRLAVACGAEQEEVAGELHRIAATLEEGGWDSLRAVAAL